MNKSTWISVKDTLPPLDKPVLLCIIPKKTGKPFCEVGKYYPAPDGEPYFHTYDDAFDFRRFDFYWQDLTKYEHLGYNPPVDKQEYLDI